MLVLSRRPDETIVFPHLGVTVRVLRVQGNVVRIGVEAPPEVRVLRHELADRPVPERARRPSPSHALRNRLNKVGLSLHLLQRQLQVGRAEAADATLANALEQLTSLDLELLAA